MTGIMIGFTRARHLLGTVYGNYSLTAADTGINAAGPNGAGSGNSTISLPAVPWSSQIISLRNVGTGTVTVDGNGNNIGSSATTTITAGTSKWFAWGGYTWGFVFGGSCETVTLPATKDFGTTTQGPAETPYNVPADTVTYSNIGYTPCGGLLRKIITTTYDGRSIADQWKNAIQWVEWQAPTDYAAGETPAALFAPSGISTAYGTSSADALTNQLTNSFAAFQATMAGGTYSGFYKTTGFGAGTSGYYKDLYYNYYPSQPPDTGVVMYGGQTPISTQISLYYLDTNIVWTYDII